MAEQTPHDAENNHPDREVQALHWNNTTPDIAQLVLKDWKLVYLQI
jgi:hypothetical protein